MSATNNPPVVTRFAPSPTGFLHIGSARTALFNWLFAKANNGRMLLRVEDTDRKRSTQQASDAIYDGLNWLGLGWDGDAISQHAGAKRHQQVALEMVKNGHAYYCHASKEEVAQMREISHRDGVPMVYEWRERPASDAPKDATGVIRLKSPRDGETLVDDVVQGQVRFANKDLDDMILLRSDGSPTYMHAVVVDDHDMGVTHIIRGDDHLTNAARQVLIYQAMGWRVPVMVHIPLIHGADGAKLSKRHGAMGVDGYRAMGYLPEALCNYLVRLGWSHGDDEIISIDQMISWFDIKAIGKGASRFDFGKLDHINHHYIRHGDNDMLADQLISNAQYLAGAEHLRANSNGNNREILVGVMGLIKEKAKNLDALAIASQFAFQLRPIKLDDKAEKILDADSRQIIARLIPVLKALDNWNEVQISEAVRQFCDEAELKLGKVAQPVRCAIAGTPNAPGVFEVMKYLGSEETLQRLGDQAQNA